MAGSRTKKAAATPAQPLAEQPWYADPAMAGLFRADAARPRPQEAPPLANEDSYTTSDAATITGNLLTNGTPSNVSFSLGGNSAHNVITGGAANIIITGGDGNDILVGGDDSDTLRGLGGNDIMYGQGGHDLLDGGAGADLMDGGTGNDIYFIDQQDTIVEQAGGGTDEVNVTFDYTLLANFENLFARGAAGTSFITVSTPLSLVGNELANRILGGSGADILVGAVGDDTLMGGGGNDSLYGEIGSDSLDGDSGSDLMDGGVGADFYLVDNVGDVVIEAFEAGQSHVNGDLIRTFISYTLAADQHIEKIGAEQFGLTLTGNDLAQALGGNGYIHSGEILIGMGGDDILDGGLGVDTTDGGFGDDLHYVRDPNDIIIERAGEGHDAVYMDISFVLTAGAHVEAMAPLTTALELNINMTGNSFVQAIYGTNGANVINGGGGADYLAGAGGNDTYFINAGNEIVVENANGGRDVVYSSRDYSLTVGSDVEVLSAGALGDTTALHLAGNELAQAIYGNAGANSLYSQGGADYLAGFGGDDTYFVSGGGEHVAEQAGQGRDVVYAGISYALAAGSHVEALAADSILATTAIDLAGNGFDNEIYGNNGANTLDGGGGGDYLVGWGGDDIYLIFSGAEIVVENAAGGRDAVYAAVSYGLAAGSQVEALSTALILGTGVINLTGNELGQEVYGNNGANSLDGGGGGDYMLGYGGADNFAFTTALGGGNVDMLGDFSVADDTILLDNAVFTGLANGALAARAFVTGPAARDNEDRIVYNSATGQIFFDADGSGAAAAVHFATVNAGTVLAATDFIVI